MIQVIDKALDIIELISQDPEKIWPLGSVADPLNMNHGTCANIIKTLVNRNYLERMPAKKGYKLGMMAYKLTANRNYKNELMTIARSEMTRLTKLFNENTLLAVLQGSKRVGIIRISCEHQIQVITPAEKDAYDSSTGRLLIAMKSDEELEEFIKQNGLPKDITGKRKLSKRAFMDEVKEIRNEGCFALLPDDQVLGVAYPIYQQDQVIASISIYAPAFRCTETKKKKMQIELEKAAQAISSRISFA
jgi:DNA-binding IclR family transcriptional regulator